MFSLGLSKLYATLVLTIVLHLFPLIRVSCLGTGSTISVNFGSNTICGILRGASQVVQCNKQSQIITPSPSNSSYDSISGGRDFFCGLTSGGHSLHCWDTNIIDINNSFQVKILYDNASESLISLSVGEHQICALHSITNLVQCWRKGSPPFPPPKMPLRFTTITSGSDFSCGIVMETNLVSCWGVSGIGDLIEKEFGSTPMLTLVAGKSHACGLAMASGVLICKGSNTSGQLNVPLNQGLQFSSVALGANHTCALLSNNGSVVCWGGDRLGPSSVVDASFSFESIVAGLDFTCGLRFSNLSIICWGPGWPTRLSISLSEKVIPGPCVNGTCGTCGRYLNSASLCARKDLSICNSCVILPSSTPLEAPAPGLIASTIPSNKNGSQWAYAVFGSFGILVALVALFLVIRNQQTDKLTKPVLDSKASDVALKNAMHSNYPSSEPHSRSSSMNHRNRAEKFSLGSLAAATENFSPDNVIGSGSFGVVYKGRLANGRPVAIKRQDMKRRRMKEFVGSNDSIDFGSDLELLFRLHHKHLVGLVGFCQENEERLLVYELMSNGALHDHLHTDKADVTLKSWSKRIKVALDAARGIEYLHKYAVPLIIHRDIKSSNILIDSDWMARISDFGLSLISELNDTNYVGVGTVGYIDPEFYVSKVLTTKSDVYGFGVVLLELLTGKKAVFRDIEGHDPMMLVEYAGPYILGGNVWKVLDKRVSFPLLNEAEAVELVAYTALRCISLDAIERPTMSEVVSNLEKSCNLCKDSLEIESFSRTVSSSSFN